MFKQHKKVISLILLLFVALGLSGCSITFGTSSNSSMIDGGVYKSFNRGVVWKQNSLVASTGSKAVSFNSANVVALAIDPQDENAIYAGTDNGGMLYSYDGGASWSVARDLGKRYVKDIKISPVDKCTIYIASENKVFKSDDCSRTWDDVYYDNNTGVMIRSLAIDPRNENIIYAGTSRGDVITSSDAGKSWSALKRFSEDKLFRGKSEMNIIKIIVNPKNSNNLWIATEANGVFKSMDRGATWQSFEEEFKEINTSNSILVSDFDLFAGDGKTIIVATKAGLLRSFDAGAHWQVVDLVPPSDSTAINAVRMHPTDASIIYYATNTSFGSTDDGGQEWTSKKLPSTRAGAVLISDPSDSDVVYLGVKSIVQK
ncbi:MAG: hypothetical protein WC323_00150 [Patescibacteria group bacterium]|jgi:photosystem II stability/assembly factor-like uncharacterized protein